MSKVAPEVAPKLASATSDNEEGKVLGEDRDQGSAEVGEEEEIDEVEEVMNKEEVHEVHKEVNEEVDKV
eukprot:CAMPEP_0118653838 /NCGR_PEP_ID=MMETSP0785-20121206/12046_1 /TAXON_ID=91992 /ORGANISM="Bolidomonas pacifica, Strain CCMP 1866" /LENGTH=68 /DNA_ID=CAMNT_0006546411 /DNA_START=266 /DNA_END=468 /DNA_ORIENTATION=+